MKLSEAIRLGSMMHPQTFNITSRRDPGDGKITATCAMGAASLAFSDEDNMSLDLNWVRTPIDVKCLYCIEEPEYFYNLPNLVVHLNDVHRWPREKIADYIEQFEKSESPNELQPQIVVAAK